jgi:hypothetical protein
MASITELRAQLTAVEAKIDNIIATAQEYSIVGQHSIKNPEIETLEAQRLRIRKRILRKSGYGGRTTPEFN